MISYKHKFVFIHIPKTAGTSLEIALEDDSCVFKRCQWHKKPPRFGIPLNHLTLNQIIKSEELTKMQLESFHKFAFVRNPWDKVISECFCGQIQLAFKGCVTIKDKIKRACSLSEDSGYGGHCKKQIDFIRNPNFKMDFIGRFENLNDDYLFICDKLGIENKALPHKHKSKKKPYQEYFDIETIDLVGETYKEDVEYFNYNFNQN